MFPNLQKLYLRPELCWWDSQGLPGRISFLIEIQFPNPYLEDSCFLKSFSSSQIKLTEPKCFVLNEFHIWQCLPVVLQRLRGFCFRCCLTSFYPVSLYNIWPYMFSFCKYSRGISIDRNKLCAYACAHIYKFLYMHTCIALVNIYISPQRTEAEWILNSTWKANVQELHSF